MGRTRARSGSAYYRRLVPFASTVVTLLWRISRDPYDLSRLSSSSYWVVRRPTLKLFDGLRNTRTCDFCYVSLCCRLILRHLKHVV